MLLTTVAARHCILPQKKDSPTLFPLYFFAVAIPDVMHLLQMAYIKQLCKQPQMPLHNAVVIVKNWRMQHA